MKNFRQISREKSLINFCEKFPSWRIFSENFRRIEKKILRIQFFTKVFDKFARKMFDKTPTVLISSKHSSPKYPSSSRKKKKSSRKIQDASLSWKIYSARWYMKDCRKLKLGIAAFFQTAWHILISLARENKAKHFKSEDANRCVDARSAAFEYLIQRTSLVNESKSDTAPFMVLVVALYTCNILRAKISFATSAATPLR